MPWRSVVPRSFVVLWSPVVPYNSVVPWSSVVPCNSVVPWSSGIRRGVLVFTVTLVVHRNYVCVILKVSSLWDILCAHFIFII